MGFELRLLDPEMLGRRFQYAFLSFSSMVEVRPEQNKAVFHSVEDFVDTVRAAAGAIIDGLTWPETARRRSKCPPYTLEDYGVECTRLDRGPSLYQAGTKSDIKNLVKAGLDKCKYLTQKCDETVAWTHAAVSYAIRVLEEGGPLGGEPVYDIPWLARATLFTKIRSVRGAVEAKEKRIDVDTLGTILLGGALAYLGSHRLADQQVEFYILPEYISPEYRVLRQIAAVDGITGNLAARTVRLVNNLSVSFEQALAVAAASLVSKHARLAQEAGVSVDSVLASGKLYTVQPGRRAQVRAGIPLTNILLRSYEEATIRALDWMIDEALRQKDKEGSRAAKNTASTCVNSLFIQAVSGGAGDLYLRDCMRDLVALYGYERVTGSMKKACDALLKRLEWESVRVLLRAR